MQRSLLRAVSALGLLFANQAFADFTVEVQVGPLDGVSAARGFLVADANGDGFSEAGPWIVGTSLAVGETLGASDDLILAVFGASDSLAWPSDTGFGSVLSGLSGVPEGTALAVYWIAGANDAPSVIAAGSTVSRLVDVGFSSPADGATGRIVALTPALGGTLNNDDIDGGAVGSDSTNLSVNTPTAVNLDPGDSTYFLFEAQSGNGLNLDLNGNESVSGTVFDLSGNLIASFTDTELNLPSGSYYLGLTETSGTSPASFDVTLISSEYQPDLWIRGKHKRARRNNVYSIRPSVQKYRMAMRKTLNYSLVLENDSFLSDNLKLTASNLRSPFRQKILEAGRGNVTSKLRLGSYYSGEMDGRTSKTLRVTIKVNRPRNSSRRYRASQNYFAQSTTDLVKRDTLCVRLMSKK